MASTQAHDLWQSLSQDPETRFLAVANDEPLTPAESTIFDRIRFEPRKGRCVYWVLTGLEVPPLSAVTSGRQIWENEKETAGEYKISLMFPESGVSATLCLVEQLIKRKLGAEYSAEADAQRVAAASDTCIGPVYGMKANIRLPPGRQTCQVMRRMPDGAVLTVPTENVMDFESGGVPVQDMRSAKSDVPRACRVNYAVDVQLAATLVMGDMVRWEVKRIIIGEESDYAPKSFSSVPVGIAQISGAVWTLAQAVTKGGNCSSFHELKHSLSRNKFSAPFWLSDDPLQVAVVWPNQDRPEKELVLCVSASDSQAAAIEGVCAKIELEIERDVQTLCPKYKPNKKVAWRVATKLCVPQKGQTPEEVEKYGPRQGHWFKVKVQLQDTGAGMRAPAVYRLADEQDPERELLLSTDPELLVKTGRLVKCASGNCLGVDAKVFVAVIVSKLNLTPKFSYGFRASHIIAVTLGQGNEYGNSMQTADGQVVVPLQVSSTDFAEAMRNLKRPRPYEDRSANGVQSPLHE